MQKFTTLTSIATPLPKDNVDTDQIIPAEFLKTTTKEGLGDGLFFAWRQDPDFVLNNSQYKGSEILVAHDNFGCGSSREHAPWALTDYGFRVVIAISFADIFKNNSLKNGLLPIELKKTELDEILEIILNNPEQELTIDLEKQKVILNNNQQFDFEIDPFRKRCFLKGVDDLGYILEFEDQISEYEKNTPIKEVEL